MLSKKTEATDQPSAFPPGMRALAVTLLSGAAAAFTPSCRAPELSGEAPVLLSESQFDVIQDKNLHYVERAAELREALQDFKSVGYQLEARTALLGSEQDRLGFMEFLNQDAEARQSPSFCLETTSSPHEFFQVLYASDLELPQHFRERAGEAAVYPLTLETHQLDDSRGVVCIRNWLANGRPIFEREVELTSENQTVAAREMNDFLTALYRSDFLQREIDLIPADTDFASQWKPAYAAGPELNADQHAALGRLALHAGNYGVRFEGDPWGLEVDRVIQAKGGPITPGIRLDQWFLEGSNYQTVKYNGQIQRVAISLTFRPGDDVYDQWPTDVTKREERGIDPRFGNFYLLDARYSEGKLSISLDLFPPSSFADAPLPENAEPEYEDLNFDLSVFGFGDLCGYIKQRVEYPVTTIGTENSLRVYANFSKEELMETMSTTFEDIEKGVRRIEELFSAEGATENIYYLRARNVNAHYRKTDPETVSIRGRFDLEADSYEVVARHETIHLVADRFNIGESEEFRKWYQELRATHPRFLRRINEDPWLGLDDHTGHAQSNADELVASFINGLLHPDWEEKIAKQEGAFLELYRESLEAFQIEMTRPQCSLSSDAPVRSLIASRIQHIESLEMEKSQEREKEAPRVR